jgi:hypothetical protein
VFAFDLFIVFFMFILIPRHKSHESMKIGPHPRGQFLSDEAWRWVGDMEHCQSGEWWRKGHGSRDAWILLGEEGSHVMARWGN